MEDIRESELFKTVKVPKSSEHDLRTYRRLYLSEIDLEEAQAIIDELLRLKIPYPRTDRPSPLLMALTSSLIVSYSRPFINSRGPSDFAERVAPGTLLRKLTKKQRSYHNGILEIRNREVAHSDADITELIIRLYTMSLRIKSYN